MENKFNETGADFGKISYLPKSRNHELIADSVCRKEPAEGEGLHIKSFLSLSLSSLKGGDAIIAVE